MTNHRTVLLVEDEPKVLERIKFMLEQCEYSVIAADDPDSALELYKSRQGRVDVLLTDVSLPRMNGYTLSRKLLAEQPGLKVLFMSGFFEDTLEKYYGVNLADQAFIHKPFSTEALSERMTELLDGRV